MANQEEKEITSGVPQEFLVGRVCVVWKCLPSLSDADDTVVIITAATE